MKKTILILLMVCSQTFAVGEAAAVFLLIAPGAGVAGTGEAQVAKADDAYASYYNPAGLGFLTGSQLSVMHVNWLPNLADDIYYEFLAYRKEISGVGTIGGHLIFLNLGEQIQTDENATELGTFGSNMWAITTSFGTTLNSSSSLGLSFKVIQQNLAPSGAGVEEGEGSSTNILFDVGYLKKFNFGRNQTNFGLSISNIGPEIWFKDYNQRDPAPTNMKFGIYSTLLNTNHNKLSLLIDANKLLVAKYPSMDWNGDGVINNATSGYPESGHQDPWYRAVFTAWLDDWYFGGDIDYDDNGIIGGYGCDGAVTETNNGTYLCDDEEFDNGWIEMDGGIYSDADANDKRKIEKGSGESRSFKTELEEMIYNIGIEYWYSSIFVARVGYIYDYEGKVINPTFGAGLKFGQYGFDFGYTAGEQGHPRANTMFFSVNVGL